jgi:hypothetical protein
MTDQPNQDAGGIPYWPDTDAPPTDEYESQADYEEHMAALGDPDQEGRPTGDDDPRTIEQQMIDGDRLPVPPYRPSEGRPITPPVHNHGPEEGPGLRCRERLTGDCLRSVLDVERLAELLVLSGFIARYQDYAHRAHPATMAREDPTDIARSWAADILAAAPPEASER